MFQLVKTLASAIANAAAGKVRVFINDSGQLCTKDEAGTVVIIGSGGGGGASIPNYTADKTAAYTLVAGDLQNLVVYNSASNNNITIPNDTTLSITGLVNASVEVYQKGSGVPNFVAGAGVTLVTWSGYPTSTIGVTQTAHRVGANTWAVK